MEQESVIVKVCTKDGKEYKLEKDLFSKYSKYFQTMMQDYQEDVFMLYQIDSWEFDFLYEFLQLHRNHAPITLKPVYPQVNLRDVMEEADAQLVQRIFSNPPGRAKKVIDAAFFLHMDDFLRRLTAGIVSSLKKQETMKMVAQSKKSNKLDSSQVSNEIHKKIELILFKNKQKQEEIKPE